MPEALREYPDLVKKHVCSDYEGMFRPAGAALKYPFLTPGSEQYADSSGTGITWY